LLVACINIHAVFIAAFIAQLALVFISSDSVNSVVSGTHAQQLNCEVLCGRQIDKPEVQRYDTIWCTDAGLECTAPAWEKHTFFCCWPCWYCRLSD